MSDASLSLRHRAINAIMRTVYFGRVPVLDLGEESGAEAVRRPRLIIASHRNGAIDGHQVLAAFPRVQFLVSIQLLRHWFLRLFIAGIPVVRPKDVERYGLDPASVASPVEAGLAHLRRGGDLGVFPEASSEWGHRPQPYKPGAVRIACTLAEEGIEVEIVPVGLFYSTPDRFRSRAEVVRGPSVTIPERGGRERRVWEAEVASVLGDALDAVSVDCPDEAAFDRIQAEALDRARRAPDGPATFARAFLALQEQGRASGATAPRASEGAVPSPRTYTVIRGLGLVLMWLFAPVLAAAAFAGSRADGRNTVTFFRLLGGFAVAMVWVPALIVAAVFWPTIIGAGVLSGVLGWLLLGMRRTRL